MRLTALLLLGAVALLTACGVTPEQKARALDADAAPYRVVTRDAPDVSFGARRFSVFLVRQRALVAVPRRTTGAPTPPVLLSALAAGPSEAEQAAGITSGLSLGLEAAVKSVDGGVVTVSLPARTDSTRTDAVLGFAQIVLTLTQLPAVTAVRFEAAGLPLQVPRADGSLADGALTRRDYAPLVPPG